MAELIRYILLVNIFLLVLSLFFRILLQKENWLRMNRFVLLAGMALALIIPLWQLDLVKSPEQALIVIPEDFRSLEAINPDFILDEIQIYGHAPKTIPWIGIIMMIYIGGIIGMGITFLLQINRIKQLQKSNPMLWWKNLFISLIPNKNTPFSFLGVVYYPEPLDPDHSVSKIILEHERVHVRQRHSLDLLFVELVKILFFYNPAVYTLRKQLEMTHEFLADAVSCSGDPGAYSKALIEYFFRIPGFSLVNAFKSTSLIRERLIRLESGASNKWAGIKYSMVVPMVGLFIMLSAFTLVIP